MAEGHLLGLSSRLPGSRMHRVCYACSPRGRAPQSSRILASGLLRLVYSPHPWQPGPGHPTDAQFIPSSLSPALPREQKAGKRQSLSTARARDSFSILPAHFRNSLFLQRASDYQGWWSLLAEVIPLEKARSSCLPALPWCEIKATIWTCLLAMASVTPAPP